jgi:uncharacterized protein (DUF697 family)
MKIKEAFGSVASEIDTAIDKIGRTVGADIPQDYATDKSKLAMRTVRRYTALSFAGGFIPFPLVDLLAVSSSQLAMLAEVASIYEDGKVPNKERLRIVVSSVLGSVVPQGLTVGIAGSAIKAVPVFGTFAGMILMPTLSSAVTFAIGKAFISHFEGGGTFLDLDPEKLKEHYKANLSEAAADNPALAPVDTATLDAPIVDPSPAAAMTATEAKPKSSRSAAASTAP